MTAPLPRYAIEIESHIGRSFVLTGFETSSGSRYDGILFFESNAAATKSMLDDAEEGDNDWITSLLVHADGTITDALTGQDLIPGLSAQTSFTEEELKEMAASYYNDERAAAEPQIPDAPGF